MCFLDSCEFVHYCMFGFIQVTSVVKLFKTTLPLRYLEGLLVETEHC